MSTTLVSLRDPVRAILGDFSSVVRKYQDTAIDAVIQMLVQTGRIGSGYALTTGNTVITPAVTGVTLGRLLYLAAKTFVAPNAASFSYRTRAMSESFGDQKSFLYELELALHEFDANGGGMFGVQGDFRSWMLSVAGGDMDVWEQMTDMQVNAPVATVTIGGSGIQVNT